MKILLIGIGGFVGAISRYALGGLIHKVLNQPWFPYGTLGVNILGCLLIGYLSGLADTRQLFSPETRMLVFIGMLGGFTTFSTFAFESFAFLRDGQVWLTIVNIGSHVILGVLAVYSGMWLSRIL